MIIGLIAVFILLIALKVWSLHTETYGAEAYDLYDETLKRED